MSDAVEWGPGEMLLAHGYGCAEAPPELLAELREEGSVMLECADPRESNMHQHKEKSDA